MNCPGEEMLKASLDGELPEAESRKVQAHIVSCQACHKRMQQIRAQAEVVGRALSTLEAEPTNTEIDGLAAYARLAARADRPGRPAQVAPDPMGLTQGWRPGLWAALAAAVAIAVVFATFAPARVWAQKVLSMLRVQKIAVVPVNSTFLPTGNSRNPVAQRIQRLISSDVTVTMKPGPPQRAASASAASAMAGFPVHLFAKQGSPKKIEVMGEAAANMILRRDRLQQILDAAGRRDLQIPASADGAMIAIQIPKSVVATYGNCPPPEHGKGRPANARPRTGSGDFSSCVVLYQGPSPTVSVPPDLNLSQLAQIGLEFTGMTPQQAAEFCRTVNWTSTLVIPVPQDAGSYSEVEVGGVKGALLKSRLNGHRGYTLIWVKNGMVYSIVELSDRSQATLLGDSLGI